MLVVRRRAGEAVLIGEGVEVTVIDVAGSRVKLGIAAPPEVPILRKEVQLAAQQNVAASAGATPQSVSSILQALRARSLTSPLAPPRAAEPLPR